jgi:hypothetical protein
MTPDKQERIKACIQELAALLYEETDKSKLIELEGIEKTVRRQILEQVSPDIAIFLSNKQLERR